MSEIKKKSTEMLEIITDALKDFPNPELSAADKKFLKSDMNTEMKKYQEFINKKVNSNGKTNWPSDADKKAYETVCKALGAMNCVYDLKLNLTCLESCQKSPKKSKTKPKSKSKPKAKTI
jgi:hypothetical protein